MTKQRRARRYGSADYQSYMNKVHPRMAELAYLQACVGNAASLMEQSEPLEGTIFTEQGVMDVAQAVEVFKVGQVVHRFGTWVVTADGIACLVRHYPLTRARLDEHEDWASHLAEQSWTNLWDVVRALAVARRRDVPHDDEQQRGGDSHPS